MKMSMQVERLQPPPFKKMLQKFMILGFTPDRWLLGKKLKEQLYRIMWYTIYFLSNWTWTWTSLWWRDQNACVGKNVLHAFNGLPRLNSLFSKRLSRSQSVDGEIVFILRDTVEKWYLQYGCCKYLAVESKEMDPRMCAIIKKKHSRYLSVSFTLFSSW